MSDAIHVHCSDNVLVYIGGVEPSSPNHPTFEDETDVLLGNDGDIPPEDEEDGEELFGDNFER